MKLVRFGEAGAETPGMIDAEGKLRDLSGHVADISGESLGDASLKALRAIDPETLPLIEGGARFGPCVGRVGKLMCIGLNYKDHAEETGMKAPDYPILFMKATSAICGANDTVSLPRGSTQTDWEAELGVVIGTAAKYVSADEALNHVAGYCIVNDISEREFQARRSGQWTKGKSCDTFGPLGPWLVTKDEIPDPQNLSVSLRVNGQVMQDGHTSNMIFSVAQIIAHLSELMTLHPGDIISTGTPAGVGLGMKPDPVFLKPGDVMELAIEGLGVQRQNVVMDP